MTTEQAAQTNESLAVLLSEIAVWDTPQVCVCGSYCWHTALGQAFNAARDAGILFETLGRDEHYGHKCEDDYSE